MQVPSICQLLGISFPDRSGVYPQCSAVYTASPLQFEQCSWSVHCPCRVHCLYTPSIFWSDKCWPLLVHCREYTACTLQSMLCSCSLHCTVHEAYVQSYTACTLHFNLGWYHLAFAWYMLDYSSPSSQRASDKQLHKCHTSVKHVSSICQEAHGRKASALSMLTLL